MNSYTYFRNFSDLFFLYCLHRTRESIEMFEESPRGFYKYTAPSFAHFITKKLINVREIFLYITRLTFSYLSLNACKHYVCAGNKINKEVINKHNVYEVFRLQVNIVRIQFSFTDLLMTPHCEPLVK